MDVKEYIPSNQELIDQFIAKKRSSGKAPLTTKNYEEFLTHVSNGCNQSFKDIQPSDLRNWLENYRGKKKARTMKQRQAILRGFFNHCVKNKVIDKSPVRRRMNPRLIGSSLTQCMTRTEKASIKRQSEDLSLRDQCIFLCLQSSGMRRSELTGLNIKDVNLETRSARVTGKGNKERIVKLSEEACYHLAQLIESQPDGVALFVNRYNNRLSNKHVWRICNRLGKKAQILHSIYPHMMRRGYCSDEIAHGEKILEVKKRMGHEKLETTMIYLNVPIEDLIAAYDRGIE